MPRMSKKRKQVAIQGLCSLSTPSPIERRYLLRVPLILDTKKDCSRHALKSPGFHIVRLLLCFFDFRYLSCRCGYTPYALIAHTV